jgi:hypothetical protein
MKRLIMGAADKKYRSNFVHAGIATKSLNIVDKALKNVHFGIQH